MIQQKVKEQADLEVQECKVMRYVYDTNKRVLRDTLYFNKGGGVQTHRPIQLSKREGQLLMLLSDGNSHTYEEICEFLWKLEVVTYKKTKGKTRIIDRRTAMSRIRTVASRLERRIRTFETHLKHRWGIGIKLGGKEEIWLE